jgi:arginine utilization regulatory protein
MEINSIEFLNVLLELLLQNIDEGIHVTDEWGTTLFYNSAAARIDGISRQEAVGKHVLELFPSLNEETSTILQALTGGNPVQKLQQHISNLHGTPVLLESTTVPLRTREGILGAVDISRDLTKVKVLTDQVVDLQSRLTGSEGRVQKERAYYRLEDLVGIAPELLAVKHKASRVARSNSPVLVTGETGTGKELLVQGIHNASIRQTGAFIAQNCAALPASLMEGMLFGTVKGSFTGSENRPGLVEMADGGTLLLDELTCMDVELQSKLLRFIQDGFIRRLGDSKVRKVNVRIIATTNIDPREAVKQNLLRHDLYYRLNVVHIVMPTLRSRRDDIPLLAQHFLQELNKSLGTALKGWTPDVDRVLQEYSWPGNVRELKAAIESAINMADAPYIQLTDLPAHIVSEPVKEGTENVCAFDLGQLSLPKAMARVENSLIEKALSTCQGNISQAAKLLGIPRQTLQYKLKGMDHLT